MGTHFARDTEGDGLDGVAVDFVCARDLALGDIEGAPGKESHAALRFRGLELVERVQRIVLVLVVADVPVALASCDRC